MLNKKPKVFVGMSGGVDSSTSAALLKKAGYDVTGVFIRVWEPEGIKCTWREDRRDAMRVAAILDIPFVTIDLSKEYKQEVVDYMVREYRLGRTPNPDVMCNKAVKFGAFYNWAMGRGANFVATGHYAQIQCGPTPNPLPKGEGVNTNTRWDTADKYLYSQLQEKALEMRKNPTPAEEKLWQVLRTNSSGGHFRRQHVIGKFIVDFVCLDKSLVIEVDGDIHDYQKEADQERTEFLESVGFKIVRFKNEEVLNSLDSVVSRIKALSFGEGLGGAALATAVDQEKDQTYFLWTLSGEQLKHTLFPIGGYKKSDVRKLAEKFKLPTAQKPDSQGLCFIGKLDFAEFLKGFIKPKKGSVLNEKSQVIGHHDGATFLTLGQRHGFTIDHKTPDDKSLYIVAKDIKQNTVTVSPNWSESAGTRQEISISSLNLTTDHPARHASQAMAGGYPLTTNLKCRLRYRQALVSCKLLDIGCLTKPNTECRVLFTESQIATPGQSVVFYDGIKCLGGGVIE